MKSYVIFFAVALAFFISSSSAYAVTFNWSYSDGGSNTGSGTFDAVDQGSGQFLVDGMTGIANGQTITGLTDYAVPNQTIYTTIPHLDSFGVAFTVTGNLAYNLYFWNSAGAGVDGYDCGVTGYCLMGPGTPGTSGLGDPSNNIAQDNTVPVDFTLAEVSEVPLPASLPMMILALAFSGFVWQQRRQTI